MATKYTTIAEKTTVWKNNPNATGDFDSKLAVRTLPRGTVVDVISEGQTMTSWSTTPILNIGNGEWINKEMYNSVSVKPTTSEVKQQNLLAGGNNTLTAEDKFYEMLGIKKTDGTGWGLQSRPMGRILVAVVLVAGYFAYKKFKK